MPAAASTLKPADHQHGTIAGEFRHEASRRLVHARLGVGDETSDRGIELALDRDVLRDRAVGTRAGRKLAPAQGKQVV